MQAVRHDVANGLHGFRGGGIAQRAGHVLLVQNLLADPVTATQARSRDTSCS
ncbi:hypothetical protein MAHJHV57_49680 [Mycobacterium avium subsp. hominissuis]